MDTVLTLTVSSVTYEVSDSTVSQEVSLSQAVQGSDERWQMPVPSLWKDNRNVIAPSPSKRTQRLLDDFSQPRGGPGATLLIASPSGSTPQAPLESGCPRPPAQSRSHLQLPLTCRTLTAPNLPPLSQGPPSVHSAQCSSLGFPCVCV